MSWIEDLKTDFLITTGDGVQYKVNWLNAVKQVEYNTAEFEFPNVEGTLVSRKLRKGTKYGIEIYFQGEECITQSLAFEQSAKDPRYWVISHPFYGNINVQPVSLNIDNSVYNVSKITGTVVETITNTGTKVTVDKTAKIQSSKDSLDTKIQSSIKSTPQSSDITKLQRNITGIYKKGVNVVNVQAEAEAYYNAFNEANALVLNLTSDPIAACRGLQAVLNYPSQFAVNVSQRLSLLADQFGSLRTSLSNLFGKSGKEFYQAQGASIISSMAIAAANPQDGDYGNRSDVLASIEPITSNYDSFITDLDSIQGVNGGDEDAFIPDADSILELNQLINFTVSNLFDIALDAKQERTVFLEKDSNLILLTHRFYGLDPDDENINSFIKNNQIGLNEYLNIRKGRLIKYYV